VLTPAERKRLPRYEFVPVALVGRLAVSSDYKGRKLGSTLLFDAAERSIRADTAVFGLFVEAKDQDAAAFYLHYGFLPFPDDALSLYLPLSTFEKI
jgi:predicted GNAT family N-acyltransferase